MKNHISKQTKAKSAVMRRHRQADENGGRKKNPQFADDIVKKMEVAANKLKG